MPVQLEPWTAAEVLEYLSAYGATVVLKGGRPYLDLPDVPCDRWGKPHPRREILAAVLPHLRARREEVIAILRAGDPAARADERRRVVAEVAARAAKADRVL